MTGEPKADTAPLGVEEEPKSDAASTLAMEELTSAVQIAAAVGDQGEPYMMLDDGGERPAASEEPAAGMKSVGPVAPRESQEVEPVPAIDEEVEVIERDETPPQIVRIFRTQGQEVVVVEEEKTSLEVKHLRSTLNNCMKKIEVSRGR